MSIFEFATCSVFEFLTPVKAEVIKPTQSCIRLNQECTRASPKAHNESHLQQPKSFSCFFDRDSKIQTVISCKNIHSTKKKHSSLLS